MSRKVLHLLPVLFLLMALVPNAIFAGEDLGNTAETGFVEFPIAHYRATQDRLVSMDGDGKGTILVATIDGYLNVTHDNGKTWVSRALPTRDMYAVRYAGGKWYLSTMNVDKPDSEIRLYVSDDGDRWSPFTLSDHATIKNVQYINGKYIVVAYQGLFSNKTFIFASDDGISFEKVATFADAAYPYEGMFVTWNGTRYTAIGGGYVFRGKPTGGRNQFLLDAREPRSVELIVYTSDDLKNWTMQSGAVKSDLNYSICSWAEGPVSYCYSVMEEALPSDGVMQLFDSYGNTIVSRDGINFSIDKNAKVPRPSSEYSSPVFKAGDQYMFFAQYWHNTGTRKSRIFTSRDRANWKETKLENVPNLMQVRQFGRTFVGYNMTDGEMAVSNDGFTWTFIRGPRAANPQSIGIKIDGTSVDVTPKPRLVDGTTFIPLRGVFEKLGAVVTFSAEDRSISIRKGQKQIHMQIGSKTATVNDRQVTLTAAPFTEDGSTFVPLRFAGESLDVDVTWDAAKRTVVIDTKK